LGSVSITGFPTDVDVVGNKAYIGTSLFGIDVYDISNPMAPTRLGGFDGPFGYWDWLVSSSLMFGASGSGGIHIIDVSDPVRPIPVGGYATGGNARHVSVQGGRVASADWGIRLFEFSRGLFQTISFEPPPWVQMTSPQLTLEASANSGLPVAFDLLSGPATLAGNQLNFTGSGTAVVRASQAGNVQFFPVAVERSVTAANEPILYIERQGTDVRIRWPSWANDYSLEFVAQLGSGAPWQPVATSPVAQGDFLVAVVPVGPSQRYFRLRRP
jgi:hypothetical protein